MANITVNPNGDGSLGPWTDAVGGTANIYTNIDEGTTSPDDADYIKGTAIGSGTEYYYVLLEDMPEDFDTITGLTVNIRVRHSSSKGDVAHLQDVQLVKSDGTTALTTAATVADTTTVATYAVTMSLSGDTDKTSWDGAKLKLGVFGTDGQVEVFAVDLDITYTAIVSTTPIEMNIDLLDVPDPKLLLYIPGGSDTEVNTSGGDAITQISQGLGSWVATVSQALSGLHRVEVVSGTVLLGTGWIYLNGTSDRHYAEETRLAEWQ